MPRKKRSASPFELMDDDFDDNSSQSSRNGNPPIQRNAANARERARMRVLSSAFGRLKTKLPNIPADTKLSKLDTLRLATMYIKQLKAVVEGGSGAASPTTNGDIMEGSLNNNTQNCYLNLNTGVQSMNWPFGFHHHLSNSTFVRSTSANNSMNSNNHNNSSSHGNNNNNWCQNDNNSEGQLKQHPRYDNENYEQHQQQSSSFLEHNTSLPQHNHNNHHWYSETPSPELDSTTSTCLTYENGHLQTDSIQHQQQLHNNQHYHHHMPHLTAAHSSSPYHLQHDFHYQTSTPSSQHLHLPSNRFLNSSNFQATSIR